MGRLCIKFRDAKSKGKQNRESMAGYSLEAKTVNKSCQRTTTLAGQQPSLNSG